MDNISIQNSILQVSRHQSPTGESDKYDDVANHSGPFNQSCFSDSSEEDIPLEGVSAGLLTPGECK